MNRMADRYRLATGMMLILAMCGRAPQAEPVASLEDASEPATSATGEVDETSPKLTWSYGTFDARTAFFDQMLEQGVSANQIQSLVNTLKPVYDFRKAQLDHRWGLAWHDGVLRRFTLEVSAIRTYQVDFDSDAPKLEQRDLPVRVIPEVVRGEINSSLFQALQHEPQGAVLAMKLAQVFAWDIDFYMDPRRGDRLEILIEKRFIDGEEGPAFYDYGEILAANYLGTRENFDAFLFEDEDGDPAYYNAHGQSLVRDVLRSPLKFQRITSRFKKNRFHPILKRKRPHNGVDYGAPVNTPVMAVAKGRVSKAGRYGGAGIMVSLQHHGKMETQYFHLNKIARGIHRGGKVKQGQIIGYVGQTGLATAPHLHFGMKIRNHYVDPLRQKFEPGRPVPKSKMKAFASLVASLREQFNPDVRARQRIVAREQQPSGQASPL